MKIGEIHTLIRQNKLLPNDKSFFSSVLTLLSLVDITLNDCECKNFIKVYCKKWIAANNDANYFEKSNEKWLAQDFQFTYITLNSTVNDVGRPCCSFKNSCNKTKKRKLNNVINSLSGSELLHATKLKFRNEFKYETARKIAEISDEKPVKNLMKYTPDEGLALVVDGGLSKSTYQLLRNGAEEKGCHIYPLYNDIRFSKSKCYPKNVYVDEYAVNIPLKDLLMHTLERLCDVQAPVLITMLEELTKLTFRCKAGFDGATGQSVYKQVSHNENIERNLKNEECLFMTCIVPLELSGFYNNKNVVVWRNEKPSSTAYCRPVKFSFQKETKNVVEEEKKTIVSEIENCDVINITFAGKELAVKCFIELTMVDGKIQTILSTMTNSTQCCPVCGLSPKNMNNLEKVMNLDTNNLEFKYGLSSLHAWINFFELILHVGYKKETGKWQARAVADKLAVEQVKCRIQTDFMNQLGLVVDFPKSGGSGLVTLDQMKAKRESVVQEHEKRIASEKQAKEIEKERKRKKKEQEKTEKRSKLSFGLEEEEEDENETHFEEIKPGRRLGKNPDVDTSFLPDKDREEEENKERERLRQEWVEKQEQIKAESVEVTYSYWDGSGHRKKCLMKKGDTIQKFLQQCLRDLRQEFTELRPVDVVSLMYVKEDLIIPHHYTFYDFIVNKARGKSGPLFSFDAYEDIRITQDASISKDESHAGKVCLRSWYEKNKHIFPASRWEPYDAEKKWDKYTVNDK